MAFNKYRLYEYRMIGVNRYARHISDGVSFRKTVERLALHLEQHEVVSFHIEETKASFPTSFLDMQVKVTKELRKIGFTRKINEQ